MQKIRGKQKRAVWCCVVGVLLVEVGALTNHLSSVHERCIEGSGGHVRDLDVPCPVLDVMESVKVDQAAIEKRAAVEDVDGAEVISDKLSIENHFPRGGKLIAFVDASVVISLQAKEVGGLLADQLVTLLKEVGLQRECVVIMQQRVAGPDM